MDAEVAHTHVTARLEREFEGRFDTQTVDRFVDQAFAELADHSAVMNWVPVLAERYARQQLQALARIEGHPDGLPIVLFVDTHDAGRSQLARALFERHCAGRAHSWSGGVEPATAIDAGVAATLGELEIDLAHEFPKPVTDEIIASADIVVFFAEPPMTVRAGTRVVTWPTPPLDGLSDDELSAVRDELDRSAAQLAADLSD